MSALQAILDEYRTQSLTEREKGTYFEELIVTYLKYEATYADLYSEVWLYGDWAKEHPEFGLSVKDTGIDLVAKTRGTDEYHAVQCKCYAEDYRLQKKDIDSFFTASGQKPFTNRIIVSTTNNWSKNAEDSLINQHIPVSKIDLNDLENSQIDWGKYKPNQAPTLKDKKILRPHQENALNAVKAGLKTVDRGKLIMACGTGKTFTSLKIAEEMAGKGKRVLFLVPSLSLLSQTLTEWTQESETPLHSFAVCSDSDVGKSRKKDDDIVQTFTHELRYPATTKPERLSDEMKKRHDNQHMSVVYSTYHSIDVINKAQKLEGLEDFDLIICDEAHRTTGATFGDETESNFVKVHDADFIQSKKRIYMTATPRIYADMAKASAEKDNVALCSMDDASLYGNELFVINFSEAVKRGLLVDYKVIVLAVDEAHVSSRLQSILKDDDNSLKVDDAAKIVGCWKALSKQGAEDDLVNDPDPMRRAVAFCQVIEANNKGKTHKVSSKQISSMFQEVVEAYQEQEEGHNTLTCKARHVDGSMNASEKEEKLTWLKQEPEDKTCHILSNVRCLSEGVDVPALDAVLFLTPRNSPVDVVQSVGRVMRKAEGKELGYVILPVVIPAGMTPSAALNDNKVYKVVWEVLQALRSHDDRFDATINRMDLNGNSEGKIEVVPVTGPKMEVEHTVEKVNKKSGSKPKKKSKAKGGSSIGNNHDAAGQMVDQAGLEFEVGEIERGLYAKVVKKCGNRNHWADWASDIAKIAGTHIARITAIVTDESNTVEVKAFTDFAEELRDDLNDSITNEEVIEMLAQHLITKPVFDALFEEYSFAGNNPVSQAMQHVLDVLHEHRLEKEADTLEKFYESVRMRAEGINNAEGKQKIVVELYDKFFRNAFPKMTERLGIVYTPVEVVDFIIHSINDLLQQEFGQTLGSEGVHIIDPFTGTGTFVTRLLQSGLISKDQLANKYKNEIHANEIVLLAYYIAAINIESVYHSILGAEESKYQPFEGICLTDTFQLYEKEDLISELLSDNSDRRKRQKDLDIRVIMGNPPYSAGQTNANDNNANVAYEGLDNRIRETYAANSKATLKNALYDSYIRAIRWASDRIGDSGIIGFVTNAGFLEANTADGLRKCLKEEFSSIYVFHLRGNQRTSGELSRKEGGKIFGSGSRAPIAITVLVKNTQAKDHGKILWHDVGDYLTQQQKLDIVSNFQSIKGISESNGWSEIQPDKYGDWVNQRDDSYYQHIVIGDKTKQPKLHVFDNYLNGVKTGRDVWCVNSSAHKGKYNSERMIDFFNDEVTRYRSDGDSIPVKDFINNDPESISWNRIARQKVEKGRFVEKRALHTGYVLYRPFFKQAINLYADISDLTTILRKAFPGNTAKENLAIVVSGNGAKGFSAIITDILPDIQLQFNGQCFPLYLYDSVENNSVSSVDTEELFSMEKELHTGTDFTKLNSINDEVVSHFLKAYPDKVITKEDIFYYIYGLLHSVNYRERYADNLSKELPRIPCVKSIKAFEEFSRAGRDLAELHINYETVDKYPVTIDCGKMTIDKLEPKDFYVTKMKHPKVKNNEGKSANDNSTIIYNSQITVKDVPLDAYDYMVNGKAAIEWVIERQSVTTDKKSGIVNDANDWAIETMNNPKYPLELLQRVITVSLETMRIVNNLPKLDID